MVWNSILGWVRVNIQNNKEGDTAYTIHLNEINIDTKQKNDTKTCGSGASE